MTVRWSGHTGASSYKITATPKNSPDLPVFAQFSGSTVMGSVNSLSPNTVYTMRVEAMDNAINVLSSAETEETTAPDVPSIIQAYSKHSDSITVEFTPVPGATGYIIRAENEAGFFQETMVPSSPGTVVNLSPYSDYTVSVMSYNSGGRSQPSYPVQARTAMVAPALQSVSPTNDTIEVTWVPVDHAVLYSLTVIMEGSNTRLKVTTSQTNITFTDLEPGVTYCIKATAFDSDGIPGDDITIYQITRPPVPGDVQVSLSLSRSLELYVYWQAVRGADLYYAVSSNGQNCTASGEMYCIISPLNCSENHMVTVTAQNEAGPSSPSQPEALLTCTCYTNTHKHTPANNDPRADPCPPDSVEVGEVGVGNCSVTWAAAPWVDYYVAYVKRIDGAEEQCNTTSTTCYYNCHCSYTYLTTVFAYNGAGTSPQGPILNYTTVPCCPENVSISLISTETLEISWSPVRGAELYETVAADGSDTIHCSDTMPLCALSDLTCNSLYSVVVRPCSDIRGCNDTCTAHTQETAPCSPEILNITQMNSSAVQVLWRGPNRQATYTVKAVASGSTLTCSSSGTSCDVTDLPCGTTYEVSAYANTSAGQSLPSYSVPLETGPCCPLTLTVDQVTQSMTRVEWPPATGAQSYITSLTSPRGNAKCHTMDTHCLMGCITCQTNYSVSIEAISMTGHKSQCTYHGFASNACCPSGVRLYGMANNTLRVHWRGSDSPYGYSADLYGTSTNYTCSPALGSNSCDIPQIACGQVYTVVVAPITSEGYKVSFCPGRLYSVSCSGNSVGY
ncbi:hypothetical protein NFI96_014413, partial [Prochilodus magdalenae]